MSRFCAILQMISGASIVAMRLHDRHGERANMTRYVTILMAWVLLHVASISAATQPTQQNTADEELQRKYEAALQEIERLRSELEALKRERPAAPLPPTGGAEGAPGGDFLQTGNAHFVAQRYAEAVAAYTRAIEVAPRDSRAYKQRGMA